MAELKPTEVIMKIDFVDSDGKQVLCAHAGYMQELIRCKDCQHRMATPDGDAWICAHPHNNAWRINDEHFCGYAEKQDMREDHDGSLDEGVK